MFASPIQVWCSLMIDGKTSVFIASVGNALSAKNGSLKVYAQDSGKTSLVPLLNVSDIVITKGNSLSTGLMIECSERRIPISIVSETGRRLAGISASESNRVTSRTSLLDASRDVDRATDFATLVLGTKIHNYCTMVSKASYDITDRTRRQKLTEAIDVMKARELAMRDSQSVAEAMGHEGLAAKTYFECLPQLCSSAQGKRTKRPPLTPYDLVVSMLYGLAKNSYVAALEHYGLDPYVGIIHKSNPSRHSMALDLMEEMRWACDRLAITLFNKGVVSDRDFVTNPISGEVAFSEDDVRVAVMKEWIAHRGRKVKHYSKDDMVPLSEIPYRQVVALDKYASGVCSYYPWVVSL